MHRFVSPLAAALSLAALFVAPLGVHAQTAPPNAFNFQGRVATPSGNPVADGTYSIRFRFYDAAANGTLLYEKTVTGVNVKNGVFATTVDGFTADKFNGDAWVAIRLNTDTELSPRIPILSVPYALKSNLALTVPDGSITNAKIAAGTLTADRFVSGLNTTAWLISGNSGTDPASHFLGTTDAQPLVFKTNGIERMRLGSNGNISIGSASTNNPLSVTADVLTPFALNGSNTSGTWLRLTNTTTGGNSWNIVSSGSSNGEGAGNLLFFQAGTRVIFTSSGNVGVGTTSPNSRLHISGSDNDGSTAALQITSSAQNMLLDGNEIDALGSPLYLNHNSTNPVVIDGGGGLSVSSGLYVNVLPFGDYRNVQWNEGTGQFYYDNSSRKHKCNITPLVDDFDKLLQAVPMTYTRPADPDRWEIGFIAEDFDALGLKKLVDYGKNGEVEGINYEKICLYLTAIAKHHRQELDTQRKEMNELKAGQQSADANAARMASLEAENKELKRLLQDMAQRLQNLEKTARR